MVFKWINHKFIRYLSPPGPGCSKIIQGKFKIWTLIYKSLKNKLSLILFAYNLITGYSKKNRENYPRKYFLIKETQVSTNRLSIHWAHWAQLKKKGIKLNLL